MNIAACRWPLAIFAVAVVLCVLCFYETSGAAPGAPPFKNAVQQREEMLRELQEISKLLREQNTLLRAAHEKTAPPTRR